MSDIVGVHPVSIGVTCDSGGHYEKHNNRTSNAVRENVIEEYSQFNIVYKDERLEEAFENVFGDAQRAYNEKQLEKDMSDPDHKHPTIDNYITTVIESKNYKEIENRQQICTEWIISISDMWNQIADRNTPEGRDFFRDLTFAIVENFQKAFPYIYIKQAIGHLDEVAHIDKEDEHLKDDPEIPEEGADFFTGFHIHIGGFYWGEGYKTGMNRRISERKAQELMGFKGKDRRKLIQAAMMKVVEETLNEFGMIRLVKNSDREHQSIAAYKEYAKKSADLDRFLEKGYQRIDVLEQQVQDLSTQIEEKEIQKKALSEIITDQQKTLDDVVTDLQSIKNSALEQKKTVDQVEKDIKNELVNLEMESEDLREIPKAIRNDLAARFEEQTKIEDQTITEIEDILTNPKKGSNQFLTYSTQQVNWLLDLLKELEKAKKRKDGLIKTLLKAIKTWGKTLSVMLGFGEINRSVIKKTENAIEKATKKKWQFWKNQQQEEKSK